MLMSKKLNFASLLIDEVIEDVNANYGSPPFPDQEGLERIQELLDTFSDKVENWEGQTKIDGFHGESYK